MYGAFMEPGGRNRWQMGRAGKPLKQADPHAKEGSRFDSVRGLPRYPATPAPLRTCAIEEWQFSWSNANAPFKRSFVARAVSAELPSPVYSKPPGMVTT